MEGLIMPFVSIKCPSCSANIQMLDDRKSVLCSYCGSLIHYEEMSRTGQVNIDSMLDCAETFERLGQPDEAYQKYREAIEISPSDWRAWWGACRCSCVTYEKYINYNDERYVTNSPIGQIYYADYNAYLSAYRLIGEQATKDKIKSEYENYFRCLFQRWLEEPKAFPRNLSLDAQRILPKSVLSAYWSLVDKGKEMGAKILAEFPPQVMRPSTIHMNNWQKKKYFKAMEEKRNREVEVLSSFISDDLSGFGVHHFSNHIPLALGNTFYIRWDDEEYRVFKPRKPFIVPLPEISI